MDEQFHSGIDEYILFDGGYRPDENQMLTLQLTDEMQNFAVQMDAGPIGRERYDPNEHEADHIRALFWCYQMGEFNRILVQNFTKAQAVTRRGIVLSLMDGEGRGGMTAAFWNSVRPKNIVRSFSLPLIGT